MPTLTHVLLGSVLVKVQQQHQDVQTQISSCTIHPRAHSVLQIPGANCNVHTACTAYCNAWNPPVPSSLSAGEPAQPHWTQFPLRNKHTCLVTPVFHQSLKDKNFWLLNNLQCTRKNIACLISHRVQAQCPNTLQLLSHDLQGNGVSFLGGQWSTQLEGRSRVGWSTDWLLDWSIGTTNNAVR